MGTAPALWFAESGAGPDPYEIIVTDMDDEEIASRNVGLRLRLNAPFALTSPIGGGFLLDAESATKLRDGLTAWLEKKP